MGCPNISASVYPKSASALRGQDVTIPLTVLLLTTGSPVAIYRPGIVARNADLCQPITPSSCAVSNRMGHTSTSDAGNGRAASAAASTYHRPPPRGPVLLVRRDRGLDGPGRAGLS